MRTRLLDAASPAELAEWLRLWEAWPGREVLAHPEFARLFARPCDRVAAFAGEDDGGAVLLPLILRPLSAEPWAAPGERRLDATTPYAYGGAFAWGGGPRDDAAFWRAYDSRCRESGIVSTFARLSLFPAQLAAPPEPPIHKQENVAVPLGGGPDALWAGFDTKTRRWIKTAREAGVEVERDEKGALIDEFLAVYTHTMTRREASGFYFFKREFFAAIAEKLAGRFAIFLARKDGKPLSADLALVSEERAYYFLGGTYEESYPLGPNYAVKHEALKWFDARGLKEYVLGGGYAPDDGLFRYKKAWARAGVRPFSVLNLTHDEAASRELESRRAAAEAPGWAPKPGYFPRYRA